MDELAMAARGPERGALFGIGAEEQSMTALAVQLVSLALGVAPGEIVSHRRLGARVVMARQAAMYLAHVGWGWSLAQVGRAFGRDRATVSEACRHIEEKRSDPGLDRMLDACEQALRMAPRPGVALA